MLKPEPPQESFCGSTRSGDVPTDRKFTGQRLDDTGLYYYGARYYDPAIGRFISADIVIQNPANPQSFNRYSYCLNNPLKYTDPTGLRVIIGSSDVSEIGGTVDEILYYQESGMMPPEYLLEELHGLTEGWGTDEIALLNMYEKFGSYEPEMVGILEASAITFTIVSGSLTGKVGESRGLKGETSATITLDLDAIGSEGVNGAVWVFAHEAMHGAVWDRLGSITGEGSRYEEALCCHYQHSVGLKYGYTGGNWFTYNFPTNDFDYAYRTVSKALKINLPGTPNVDVDMSPLKNAYPGLFDYPSMSVRTSVWSLSRQFGLIH